MKKLLLLSLFISACASKPHFVVVKDCNEVPNAKVKKLSLCEKL